MKEGREEDGDEGSRGQGKVGEWINNENLSTATHFRYLVWSLPYWVIQTVPPAILHRQISGSDAALHCDTAQHWPPAVYAVKEKKTRSLKIPNFATLSYRIYISAPGLHTLIILSAPGLHTSK